MLCVMMGTSRPNRQEGKLTEPPASSMQTRRSTTELNALLNNFKCASFIYNNLSEAKVQNVTFFSISSYLLNTLVFQTRALRASAAVPIAARHCSSSLQLVNAARRCSSSWHRPDATQLCLNLLICFFCVQVTCKPTRSETCSAATRSGTRSAAICCITNGAAAAIRCLGPLR